MNIHVWGGGRIEKGKERSSKTVEIVGVGRLDLKL